MDNNYEMKKAYNIGKRWMAGIAAVIMLIISAVFNVRGIRFTDPKMVWISISMAVVIIIVELVFNSRTTNYNWSWAAMGIFAYAYGLTTNFNGILDAFGATFTSLTLDYKILLCAFTAFIEFCPEPLLLWALLGMADSESDVIKNLIMLFVGLFASKDKQKAAYINQPTRISATRYFPRRPPIRQDADADENPLTFLHPRC